VNSSYLCKIDGSISGIMTIKELNIKIEKKSTIILTLLLGAMLLALLTMSLNTAHALVSERKSDTKQIPMAHCIYEGKQYKMKPYIYSSKDRQKNTIAYPDLPDRISPQMSIQKGETVTMKFDEKPKDLTAYLIDYDADKTESYPLKKDGPNAFIMEPTGIKTLEAHATFSDHRNISYTILVDVTKANHIQD
jgi:hypothetical protein